MTDSANSGQLTSDEQAELRALRARVSELEAASNPASPAPTRHRGVWRTWVATLCIVLAGILVPLSVVSVWAKAVVSDTSRYTQTVAPLASDPALQQAMATKITNEVYDYLNIDSLTQELFSQLGTRGVIPANLADQLKALQQPLDNGIKGFIQTQVAKFISSPEFEQAWIQANEVAHQQMVATLSGQSSGVTISNGQVSVNLAAVINAVKSKLVANGFTLAEKIPDVNATFTIFSDPNVTKIQTAYRLLNGLGFILPVLTIVLLAIGIYVARDHRRAFIGAGVTMFVAASVLSLALLALRAGYLNAVSSPDLPRDAAAGVFDTLIRFLKDGIRNTAIVGLAVAAGAFLIGPSVTARRTWELFRSGIGGLRTQSERLGLHLQAATDWLTPLVRTFRILVVSVAGLLYVIWSFWGYRTPALTLWFVFFVLLALAVIQFLVSKPPEEQSAGEVSMGAPA